MKISKKHRKLLILAGIVLLTAAMVLGGIKLYRVKQARKSGILLSFDDYSPEVWTYYFDLFDKYDANVTFFVILGEPTDFCYDAIERGHEIACHTASHANLTEVTPEQLQTEAIEPLEVFREKGIGMTTFAYPYGAYSEETNELLLQHYKILRGAYYYEFNSKAALRHGFVESYPLDNGYFDSDEQFEASVTRILTELSQNTGAVASLYSHNIGAGDWCITEERLIFLLEKTKELGLEFYTYQYLQDH